MLLSDADKLWQKITPEEKIDALNKAHTCGVLACINAVIISGAIAVGLKMKFIFWGVLICTPLIFQFFSSRSWKNLKPSLMLQYLAARSVVRRLAFLEQARNLEPEIIFKGFAKILPANDVDLEGISQAIHNNEFIPVWVSLFSDTIVMFKESQGGGELVFASSINEKLKFECENLNTDETNLMDIDEEKKDYLSEKEITLQYVDTRKSSNIIKLRSKQKASLLVFERKLRYILNPPKVSLAEEMPEWIEK
ncbi:MAG: hypothetical protein ACOX3T_05985 [Bdellovibrionota bacterium]